MSLITRMWATLLAIAVVVSGILYQRNQALSRSLQAEQAKAAVLDHTLTATRHSLNVYMERARAAAVRADKQQKELAHALEANPDWRDGVVPDAVFDSLYDHRGTPGTPSGNAAR